jgi:hypothetical protein
MAFDGGFVERHALLHPLAEAVHRLGPHVQFPEIGTLMAVFEGDAPVRFVPALPRRKRGQPVAERAQYDARIVLDREVPTRRECWHDLMNALVWGTFPAAKWALHARQHRAIAARMAPGATRMPPTRTRELDALALLDEGGVAIRADDPPALSAELKLRPRSLARRIEDGAADAVVFGHAIYESLVLGVTPAVVAAIVLPRDAMASGETMSTGQTMATACLRSVDRSLCDAIADAQRLESPLELARVNLEDLTPTRT